MKRESGFYWVKCDKEWIIAEYWQPTNIWFVCGEVTKWSTSDLDEIDERKIERDGQKQEGQEQKPEK